MPASGSTPPVRRTTTATAGSCSTSCVPSAGPSPPDQGAVMDLGLGGRGYLLTGASRGLGVATARAGGGGGGGGCAPPRALVDDGARVLVSSRGDESVSSAAQELGGAPAAH